MDLRLQTAKALSSQSKQFWDDVETRLTNLENNGDTAVKVGDLTQLPTTDKSSIVAAITEQEGKIDAKVASVNGVAPDAFGSVTIQTILVFDTVTDFQTLYPQGLDFPVWVKGNNDWYFYNNLPTTNSAFVNEALADFAILTI